MKADMERLLQGGVTMVGSISQLETLRIDLVG